MLRDSEEALAKGVGSVVKAEVALPEGKWKKNLRILIFSRLHFFFFLSRNLNPLLKCSTRVAWKENTTYLSGD